MTVLGHPKLFDVTKHLMIFAHWFLVLQNRWAILIHILFVRVACLILAVLHGHQPLLLTPAWL